MPSPGDLFPSEQKSGQDTEKNLNWEAAVKYDWRPLLA